MCGDGANDCGALKVAHVRLACIFIFFSLLFCFNYYVALVRYQTHASDHTRFARMHLIVVVYFVSICRWAFRCRKPRPRLQRRLRVRHRTFRVYWSYCGAQLTSVHTRIIAVCFVVIVCVCEQFCVISHSQSHLCDSRPHQLDVCLSVCLFLCDAGKDAARL